MAFTVMEAGHTSQYTRALDSYVTRGQTTYHKIIQFLADSLQADRQKNTIYYNTGELRIRRTCHISQYNRVRGNYGTDGQATAHNTISAWQLKYGRTGHRTQNKKRTAVTVNADRPHNTIWYSAWQFRYRLLGHTSCYYRGHGNFDIGEQTADRNKKVRVADTIL